MNQKINYLANETGKLAKLSELTLYEDDFTTRWPLSIRSNVSLANKKEPLARPVTCWQNLLCSVFPEGVLLPDVDPELPPMLL